MDLRFDGGLVASRHPLSLAPGELLLAQNGIYLPDSDAITRAPGWTSAASGLTTGYIVGLAGCKMPHNSTTYVLAQDINGVISTGSAATGIITLTSAHQLSASGGTSLSTTYYDKRWYLFTGAENKVFAASGTGIRFRPHGMAPVSDGFAATATAASAFAQSTTGYWEYWFTEVDKSVSDDEIESAYGAADPTTVYVTTTTASPVLTFPKPTNPNATHFRVYRSTTTKAASTGSVYPSGYAIQDVAVTAIATASGTAAVVKYTDGGTPATVTGFFPTYDSAYVSPGFASASNATGVPDGVNYTRFTRGASYDSSGGGTFGVGRGLMLYATTATASGTITGITLSVVLRSSQAGKFQLRASLGSRASATAQGQGGTTVRYFTDLPPKTSFPTGLKGARIDNNGVVLSYGQFGSKSVDMSAVGGTFVTATLGGQFDDWLPSEYDWTPSDIPNMGLLLTVIQQNTGIGDTGGETIDIDGCTITFHGNGQNADVGQLYDTISVTVGGQAIDYPAHGKPPIASTGVVFEGSLVTNDVEHPGIVAYSMPGFPDYFPAIFQFPLPEPDVITFIGVVNNRLVAATPTKLYRINYLPSEDDASFSRGRAVELISSIFGVSGPNAACLFNTEEGERLACASISGLFATDGFTYNSLIDDVRWANGIFYSAAGTNAPYVVSLVNHPHSQTIRLFVSDTASGSKGRFYPISYAPRHRKQGSGVKWAGPVYCQSGSADGIIRCATVVPYGSYYMLLAAQSDNPNANQRIWREAIFGLGEGTATLPTTGSSTLKIAPRPAALGQGDWGEGAVEGLYLYGAESSGAAPLTQFTTALSAFGAPRAAITAIQYYPNSTTASGTATTSAVATGFCTYVPIGSVNASHLQLVLEQADGTYQQELLKAELVGSDFGESEKTA